MKKIKYHDFKEGYLYYSSNEDIIMECQSRGPNFIELVFNSRYGRRPLILGRLKNTTDYSITCLLRIPEFEGIELGEI